MTSRHPFLILPCLILALFQILTAFQVLQLPGAVASALSIPVIVQIGLSAGWALLFFIAARSLYSRHPRSVRRAVGLISGFMLYSLLRLVIFARADYDRARLPFLIIATVLLLAFPVLWLILSTRGRSSDRRGDST
jgi:hypothetical protein